MQSNYERLKDLAVPLSLSGANQVVSSGTNFVFGLYLVRTLTPSEFGLYGIGLAVSLFYAGVGNALFLTQMVVHTQDKPPADRRAYAGRIFVLLCCFCFASALAVALALALGTRISTPITDNARLSIATTTAGAAFLLKDFFVRHAYNSRREVDALRINLIVAFSLFVILIGFSHAKASLDAELALFFYALTHTSAAIASFSEAKLPMRPFSIPQLRAELSEIWVHGKWGLVQNLVYWLRSQAHTYVSLLLAGPIAVGYINAAKLLLAPVQLLGPAISQILLPRLVVLRDDHPKFVRYIVLTATFLLLFTLFYIAILLFNLDFALRAILRGDYAEFQDIKILVGWWCAIACVQMLQLSVSSSLQAQKNFRSYARISAVSAISAIAGAYLFAEMMGFIGSLAGLLIGETVLLLLGIGLAGVKPGRSGHDPQ